MPETACTPEENATQAKICAAKRPNCLYARASALVQSADPVSNIVVVTVADPLKGPVNCKVDWSSFDVWSPCPSTVPFEPGSVPKPGASGLLYLEAKVVKDFGLNLKPKWPVADPGEPVYKPVDLFPLSLVLKAREVVDSYQTQGSVDLCDPAIAAPFQTIALTGGAVRVLLTQEGFDQFLLPFTDVDQLRQAVETIVSDGTQDPSALSLAWQRVAAWSERVKRLPGAGLEDAKAQLARLRL